jgi:hypothetical protein
MCPASVRIIRVLGEEHTVEVEIECEESSELLQELMKTPIGRKMAHLLNEMLPEVPEVKEGTAKEEAEAEEKRIQEHEEGLRKEGYDKAVEEYGSKTKDEIVKEAQEEIRRKYVKYIKNKQGRKKKCPECYGKYHTRLDEARAENDDMGYGGVFKIAALMKECNECPCLTDCKKDSPRVVKKE